MFIEVNSDGKIIKAFDKDTRTVSVTREIDDEAWSVPYITNEDGSYVYFQNKEEVPDPDWVRPNLKDEDGKDVYREITETRIIEKEVENEDGELEMVTVEEEVVVDIILLKDSKAKPNMIEVVVSEELRLDEDAVRPKLEIEEEIEEPLVANDTIKFINDKIIPDDFKANLQNYEYKNDQLLYIAPETPTQEPVVVETRSFEMEQAFRISEVNRKVNLKIISGFESTALGETHDYKSDTVDQLNLIGSVALESTVLFKCRPSDGEWTWKEHTNEQLKEVLASGAVYKLECIMDGKEAKDLIRACETLEDLEELDDLSV